MKTNDFKPIYIPQHTGKIAQPPPVVKEKRTDDRQKCSPEYYRFYEKQDTRNKTGKYSIHRATIYKTPTVTNDFLTR
ncbi:hypothetical protein QQ020_34950 [Fulvivirgaceae bacterium BMA12]|uniref:Uncharacterized protein n=1 Tax=Agaribacillus aureus TaxID=3051825 RepID=A0ABT8LKT0_9BACT|nr:hypothetical protein [Fulvivirgaceae bacterium BMA12]